MELDMPKARALLSALVNEVYQDAMLPTDEPSDVHTALWCDTSTDNYAVWCVGWDTVTGRVLAPSVYLRIAQGKIYVEENKTEIDLIERLLAADIPATQIVLGYMHPNERPYFEFAVA